MTYATCGKSLPIPKRIRQAYALEFEITAKVLSRCSGDCGIATVTRFPQLWRSYALGPNSTMVALTGCDHPCWCPNGIRRGVVTKKSSSLLQSAISSWYSHGSDKLDAELADDGADYTVGVALTVCNLGLLQY